MAKKLPEKMQKHKWKPGQTGNPHGRPPLTPEQRAIRELTVESFGEMIKLVLTRNLSELKAVAEHPETPALQVAIATAFMKAIKEGDYTVVERIAERIVGKIPERIEVKAQNENRTAISVQMVREALAKIEGEC